MASGLGGPADRQRPPSSAPPPPPRERCFAGCIGWVPAGADAGREPPDLLVVVRGRAPPRPPAVVVVCARRTAPRVREGAHELAMPDATRAMHPSDPADGWVKLNLKHNSCWWIMVALDEHARQGKQQRRWQLEWQAEACFARRTLAKSAYLELPEPLPIGRRPEGRGGPSRPTSTRAHHPRPVRLSGAGAWRAAKGNTLDDTTLLLSPRNAGCHRVRLVPAHLGPQGHVAVRANVGGNRVHRAAAAARGREAAASHQQQCVP